MLINKSSIGHVLAPWPFLVFGILMIAGCAVACPVAGAGRGEMIAFDLAALTFSLSCAPLFRHGSREMRRLAEMNDANRGILLLIATAVITVIMTAIGNELSRKDRPRRADVLLVILTFIFLLALQHLGVRVTLRPFVLHVKFRRQGQRWPSLPGNSRA